MTDMFKDYTGYTTVMHDEMMMGMTYNDSDAAFA